MNISRKALVVAALTALAAGPASATVVGGDVTAYPDGNLSNAHFIKLFPPFTASNPDNTVGNDNFQQPHLYAFDEEQNIMVSSEIVVDVGTNPQAGEIVASHYVFFDPQASRRQVGYVDFDAMIYGIATSLQTLHDSDYLANTGVTYLNPGLRGLEGGDQVWVDSSNPYRLWVDWDARSPGDYVRVFTMESPGGGSTSLPMPGSLWLFASAIGVLCGTAICRRPRPAAQSL